MIFNIDKLKKYRDFFNDESICFFEYRNGYINYHETVNMFIKDFYNSNIADTEYNKNLEGYIKEKVELSELIKNADIEVVKSILTCYIRGERFCDGMIAKGIEEKVFYTAINRVIEDYKE